MPLAINVLGTLERVCWAFGLESPQELEAIGQKLALLYQPRPPKKFSQAVEMGKALFDVVKAKPDRDLLPPCQQVVLKDDAVDLTRLPLLRVYAGDADKVITLGLMVTKDQFGLRFLVLTARCHQLWCLVKAIACPTG